MYDGEPDAEGLCLTTKSSGRGWDLKSLKGSDDN